jgi:glycosyl transferase, family 25
VSTWLKNGAIRLAQSLYNAAARKLPPLRGLSQEPFEALNEYFEAIWVLTIRRNVNRREHIKRHFTGMEYSFREGVDGNTLDQSDSRIDFARASKNNGRPFLMNEAACSLSHFALLQEIVSKRLKRVLIFEDDAVLVQRASKWIPYCLERVPEDWELLYLGYGDGELRGFLREFQELFGRRRDPSEVVSRSVGRGIRTAAGHDLIHAYAVTCQGAEKLLEDAHPIKHTADGWIEQKVLQRKVTGYITIPKLFVQQVDLGSSIHKG